MKKQAPIALALSLPALLLQACVENEIPDAKADVRDNVHDYIDLELDKLVTSVKAIQTAAPAPDADGWNATDDAAAVTSMKSAWKDARAHYESVEGAIAVLFGELDASTDERYDGFLAEGADDNLFDGEGVIGVHAVERIVFSDVIPASVVTFEEGLTGYQVARFPENEAEATAFRDQLVQRLLDDVTVMHDSFETLELDTNAAYRGIVGSALEQLEKVQLAESGEDESRYAQNTLTDMRNNLIGGREIFNAFRPELETLEGGTALIADVDASFARVQAKYDAIEGDAIPPVPATWNPDAPSEEDLATEYGQLTVLLQDETDVEKDLLVGRLEDGRKLLSIPEEE
jgi:iron uptake system component EfeO